MAHLSRRAARRMELLRRSAGDASRQHEVELANMASHLAAHQPATPANGSPVPSGTVAEIRAISDDLVAVVRSRGIEAAHVRDLQRIADELVDIGDRLASSRS